MPKARILVVEDEAIVRKDICLRLGAMDYQVVGEADNADQAIFQAEQLTPDIVMMDIVLKGTKDGVVAADMIKGALSIPIIFLTAYSDQATLERSQLVEPCGYIIKPFNDRDLDVAVQIALYRSRMERKLAERDEKYRDLFENTSDMILMLDDQGRIKFANQRFYQLSGYEPDDISSLSIFDVIDDECRDGCRSHFERLKFIQQTTVETRFVSKDGRGYTMEGNYSRSVSPGKSDLVRGIFRDITERNRSLLLQESLYQIAGQAFWCNDLNELYQKIHGIISRLMSTNNFYIALYDRQESLIVFPYFVDERDPAPPARQPSGGLTEYVIRNGRPLLATPDVCRQLIDAGELQIFGTPPLDWLGVPLKISERFTGVLAVQTYGQGIRFTQTERDMLVFVSEQVASAIKRTQDEAELHRREEMYRSLVEQLPSITYLLSLADGHPTIFISRQCENILGYSIEEWLSDSRLWSNKLHPEDRQRALSGLKKVIDDGQPLHQEYRIYHKGGGVIWGHDYMTLVKDGQGKPLFVQGVMIDITESKKTDDALRLSEEKYRTLVEQINEIIYQLDEDGNVQYISPVAEKVLQYSLNEVAGRSYKEFIHPEDLPELRRAFARQIAGQEEPPQEFRMLRKDGQEIYISSSLRVLYDKSGKITGLMGALTDITQSRQLAAQLQQAHKMEAIGQLAGGIAHDFNNLLSGILGNAEMLLLKIKNQPELRPLVEKVLSTGETAASLTRQLLSFARKGNYQRKPLDLHHTVREVAGMLTSTMDRKIIIRQDLQAAPSTVAGDPAMLENCLLNLCLNARDAMPQGGTLTIFSRVTELDQAYSRSRGYSVTPGKYLELSVEDTGTGMSLDVKRRIFEPFFTTKPPGKGTGLGLAGVYGCVKAHQGSVEVYSEPGHGSIFRLYFPLLENAPCLPAEPRQPCPARGTGTLLLVDDEEVIREITCQMLTEQGYRVISLSNGREAVEHYGRNWKSIDLVILDMIMPEMNGQEAYLAMKQINPGIRALLSSGYSLQEDAQNLLQMGTRGFLQKPYRLAELTQKIEQVLAE